MEQICDDNEQQSSLSIELSSQSSSESSSSEESEDSSSASSSSGNSVADKSLNNEDADQCNVLGKLVSSDTLLKVDITQDKGKISVEKSLGPVEEEKVGDANDSFEREYKLYLRETEQKNGSFKEEYKFFKESQLQKKVNGNKKDINEDELERKFEQ